MMQRLRLLALGIVGFLGVFFAHGSWLNRLLAFTLCGVLSTGSGLCLANISKFSDQATATTPLIVADRSTELLGDPTSLQNADPNIFRPEFRNQLQNGNSSGQPNSSPSGNVGSSEPPRVCLQSGEYAVFARHPIFGLDRSSPLASNPVLDALNWEGSHEHIFFCNDQQIVDNIGWNVGSVRFRYPDEALSTGRASDGGRVDDFVPIDNEQYDSDIIREIIGIESNSCQLQTQSDGTYLGVAGNCQGWTSDVRIEYWRRIKPTIEAFYCEGQKDADPCNLGWGQGISLIVEYKARRKRSLNWNITGYTMGEIGSGIVEVTKRPDSIKGSAKCSCNGDCSEPQEYGLSATISDGQNSPVSKSLKLNCGPSAGSVIQRVIDQVVPGGLPFRLPF